ncbi:MAG: DMT family transporter [Alphaproteobacteria bacterium]
MPIAAIVAALSSALIHATWNALLKGGKNRLNDSAVIAVFWVVSGIVAIALRPPVSADVWPYILASGIAHSIYWAALAKGLSVGDMSHVYTLSRGLAPALIAVVAIFAAAEVPSAPEAFGIALVCVGVLAVGFSPRAPLRATIWATITACGIACYSVIDAMGVRLSHEPLGFAGWSFVANGVVIFLFALWRRGSAPLIAAMRADWKLGALVGVVSAIGYAIVLWAQSFAPIAQVSSLRETSVVFGALIAFFFLKERLGARRWIGAALVAGGAALIAVR